MQSAQIVRAALGKSARQLGMADELGMVVTECGGAEDMVGMDMGHDHIADRQPSPGADCGPEHDPFMIAAAGVDHRDRVISDDEPDIGDFVVICR